MENHLEGTFLAFEPNLYLLPAHFSKQKLWFSNLRIREGRILISIIHDFERDTNLAMPIYCSRRSGF